jgi:IS5 family transposase
MDRLSQSHPKSQATVQEDYRRSLAQEAPPALPRSDPHHRRGRRNGPQSLRCREAQQGLDPIQHLRLQGLCAQIRHFLALSDRVLDQTRRRVLDGQSVPAAEKIVSIFEEHTDIIKKDRRDTYYGHKICLTAGASSMVLDCLILDGNPADSSLAEQMVERQEKIYGRFPKQVTFDGGFCSRSNLKAIRTRGIRDVVFSKGRGIAVHEMAKSAWVYKNLRNFRAGVEGVISFLKRAFGLDRCRWKFRPSFHSYVWSSLITCNLLLMARHTTASG